MGAAGLNPAVGAAQFARDQLLHAGQAIGRRGIGGKELLREPVKVFRLAPSGSRSNSFPTDPAPADGLARMQQFIARELRRAHRRIQPGRSHPTDKSPSVGTPGRVPLVIATSGTAAALSDACASSARNGKKPGKTAAKNRQSPRASMHKIAPPFLPALSPTREVRKLAGKLAKMTLAERVAVPGIGPRRAEIIVAGAQVFAELLESFGLEGFRYSPLGLRDGILAQMLAEQDARATAHREFEHERWESVLATARRYGVDLRHAEPVRAHALQLYRALQATAPVAAGV